MRVTGFDDGANHNIKTRNPHPFSKRGVFVSPSGVRSIWLRHGLAHFKTRLKALEAKIAEEGIILTEAQVQALEKKKLDDEAWGEIETAHPGYLGSQDTFYVGTLKGVGRIYQQTYIDTYAKTAQAKLFRQIEKADFVFDDLFITLKHEGYLSLGFDGSVRNRHQNR